MRTASPADWSAILSFDADAFGGARAHVLEALRALPNTVVFVAQHDEIAGYAIAQHGARLVGPVVARDAKIARSLIETASRSFDGPHRIALPTGMGGAVDIARDLDYTHERDLRHMVRGAAPGGDRQRIFARANLGSG